MKRSSGALCEWRRSRSSASIAGAVSSGLPATGTPRISWLPQQQIAIETKGWEGPDDPAKWAAFRSTGIQLLVFGEEAMVPVVEWICGMISPV